MYDETTVVIPLSLSFDDLDIIMKLARSKNMPRSQYILSCVRESIVREQQAWKENQEEEEESGGE